MTHMDGVALYAMTKELNTLLENGRIERISKSGKFDYTFVVRANGKNSRLLISADPESARIHLTEKGSESKEAVPPPFLMLLRKHIAKGRIVDITMDSLDRIVTFFIVAADELGDLRRYRLIAEVMGKHSNLILVDEDGTIIDAAKRVYADMSSVRTVLPGEKYIAPPAQEKASPMGFDFSTYFTSIQEPTKRAAAAITQGVLGVSPHSARMLCAMAGVLADAPLPLSDGDAAQLAGTCKSFFTMVEGGTGHPCILFLQDAPTAVFHTPVPGYDHRSFSTLSQAYDVYYAQCLEEKQLVNAKAALRASVSDHLDKLYKRLGIQNDVLLNAEAYEADQHTGELLLAYLYMIPKGAESCTLNDYLTGEDVIIKLDASLNPQQNAQRYFKRSSRKKAALSAAQAQKDEIEPQVEYLQSVLHSIETVTELGELREIREELRDQGYLRQAPGSRKGEKQQQSQPVRFRSPDGIEILVGRNNKQNDLLTTRIARSTDMWFHVQGMPGSHVVVRHKAPLPSDTMVAALNIAAYYSRGRNSANVPIDVTAIKNVRKPAGAKPGYVIFTQQRTYFITPDEKLVKSLLWEREEN